MQLIYSEVVARGAALVAVSPQTVARSRDTAQDNALTFPVLSDPGNQLAKKLGLVFKLRDDVQNIYKRGGYDLPAINGDDSWELPVPATFVIDEEGIVRWAFVDPNYARRAEPRDLLEVLDRLR